MSLVAVAVVSAASPEEGELSATGQTATADQADPTTIEVTIVSAPWATLDHNDPAGEGTRPVPRVFVVQAVVTNTGTSVAEGLTVTLDYEDPDGNWVLLDEEEDPVREFLEPLPAHEAISIYWFATYTPTVGASFQYTVTAGAANADPVSTSENYYGLPVPDATVQTIGAKNTGSTGVLSVTADVVVGAAFTVTVDFDLSENPQQLLFSPVGNLDFDPSSYRLLAAEVNFYDSGDVLIETILDRLYFAEGSVPPEATRALVVYTFVAAAPGDIRLCPYTTVEKAGPYKYGNDFCADETILDITSSVSLSLTKQVNAVDVLQGEALTYTITYANNGDLALGNVWIWDDVDPAIGSIASASGTPVVLSDQRVAWYVGQIDEVGGAQSTGTFTFTIDVDGGGADIPDQTPAVNNAFFGIDPGAVPDEIALTSTVTTTVLAPTITVTKTDGLENVNAGGELTYTLRITNSGPVPATNIVVSDSLPDGVTVVSAEPLPTNQDSQTLSWDLASLPSGESLAFTVTVSVSPILPDGTILANVMTATYENEAGWPFDPVTAIDQTRVSAPFWVLIKSDDPGTATAGQILTYTLAYYQNGVVPAASVNITDTLPAEVTYGGLVSQPAGWSGPTYDPGPPATLHWYSPTLDAGASGSMVFTVTVRPDAEGLVTNSALLTSTTPATYTITYEDTTIATLADLSIAKSGAPAPVAAGATLVYTLTYTNTGPSDAQNVTVTDILPDEVAIVSVEPVPTTQDGQTLTWDLPVVASGDSDRIVITVTVDAEAVGSLVNSAGISSSTPDDNLDNNTDELEIYIGDPARATILGYVFEDSNCNGVWDDGEEPISGATIGLTGPDPQDPAATDENGRYYFIVQEPGIYNVVEGDPDGYSSTTPNQVHLNVVLSNSYRVDFGDKLGTECAAIYGTVFEDENRNGRWDEVEPGLSGVAVTLNNAATTATGAYGAYTFSIATTGLHTVTETDPVGYMSTTPNQVDVDVAMDNGYEVNFGDFRVVEICTCAGDEYEEDDLWTQANELGVGLALGQSHNFCDDATDWMYLTVQRGFIYTVTTQSWGQRADTFMNLYDTDGQTLLAASDDYEGTEDFSSQIVWTAPMSGVYYLQAVNRAGLIGCETDYDVWVEEEENYLTYFPIIMLNQQRASQPVAQSQASVEVSEQPAPASSEPGVAIPLMPLGIITHACRDSYEVDDTWEQAMPIVGGSVQVHSFDSDPLTWTADKDFVWFELWSGQAITFTVPSITNTQTLLELYDQNGDPIPGMQGSDVLVWTAPAHGRYYLSVSPQVITYGCTEADAGSEDDIVSYALLAEVEPIWSLYLPIVMR